MRFHAGQPSSSLRIDSIVDTDGISRDQVLKAFAATHMLERYGMSMTKPQVAVANLDVSRGEDSQHCMLTVAKGEQRIVVHLTPDELCGFARNVLAFFDARRP